MGLLLKYLRVLGVCFVLMVVGALNSAHSAVLLHFTRAPSARSRFSTAVFEYSIRRPDGSNACKNNGCSVHCELDGKILKQCPSDVIVFKNLSVNHEHRFLLNVTTFSGERNSSAYSWFIDTIPPTATILSKQNYTNAERITIDIKFSETCAGTGGFKCLNSSNCDVIINGPAHIDVSSLKIIKPNIKYKLDIILPMDSIYGRVVIRMAENFCTDIAGNGFTRTNGSTIVIRFDRRPILVDLWMSLPAYELEFNGVPRTVLSTNKMEDLELFLDFSLPIMNSTEQVLKAFRLNSGSLIVIHHRCHMNRRFTFKLTNIPKTEIITVELQAGSLIGITGTPVSPVPSLTFLYDSAKPRVGLSTSSPSITKEPNINVIVEFTKPVFGFEASMVDVDGGRLTRQELSRALYSMTVQAFSQNVVSISIPAGKVNDVSGNQNSASNTLEVKHYSTPAISTALHSFVTAGILSTSLTAAILSLSSANLGTIGNLYSGSTNFMASDASMNLNGMVGHLQVFVLSDWLLTNQPIEYSETTKGLRWLIPRQKLPWRKNNDSVWPNHVYLAEEQASKQFRYQPIECSHERSYHHLTGLSLTKSYPQHELLFPPEIDPKFGGLFGRHNISMKNTPYGLLLNSSEYFTYFLRGEPLSASNVVKKLENYKGWQDLGMNLFWLGVGCSSLLIIHFLTLLFLRWRIGTPAHGMISVPRFALFLLILMLPCICQSSAFVIRGGTTGGIITGALLLAIPAALILSVCLFLVIAIFFGSFAQYKEIRYVALKEPWYTKLWFFFTGRPANGKWFYREGLPSSFFPLFGVLFENRKGPPLFVFVNENDPNTIPNWTESNQSGIGRMRAISSDDSNEDIRIPTSGRLNGSNPTEAKTLGVLMLGLLFLTFVAQLINEWYAIIKSILRLAQPQKNSFRLGMKFAVKGLVLPFLPRKYWSRVIPGSSKPITGLASVPPQSPETEYVRRNTRGPSTDPFSAMTATVVPVLSPGSPGLNVIQTTGFTPGDTSIMQQRVAEGKRAKGLKIESKNEMKKLRELAKASFCGDSTGEGASTSYAFRLQSHSPETLLDNPEASTSKFRR
ncbi:hypothetical protein Patl1_03033 [Pistacia atlantica]|uniref:Uncharacterized protein n=1 Tax=Pistacia atlantica TaxID=434234 RepID=A0ACC1CBJ9_9ROSI|nr:hypothetical protein Patl1_03033 [Pistacia atlantica]